MIYRSELKISKYALEHYDDDFKDHSIRRAIVDIIKSVPIDELKMFFNITEVDPSSKESFDKLNNPYASEYEKDEIQQLMRENTMIIKAEVEIRKDVSAKQFYKNTKNGARFSFTTKGSKIGNHGHVLIDDDPRTALQAKGEVEMLAAKEEWKGFQTRKISKESGLYILLKHRLSDNDTTVNDGKHNDDKGRN